MKMRSYARWSTWAVGLAAVLGLLVAAPVAAQSIVGAWFSDTPGKQPSSVTVFLPNGYYYNIENVAPTEAPASVSGFERGTYTYNPASGAFSATALYDTNGAAGLSVLSGFVGIRIAITGNGHFPPAKAIAPRGRCRSIACTTTGRAARRTTATR